MVAKKEEYQCGGCGDEDKSQALVQTDPAFVNGPSQAADADAGMVMRMPPRIQHPVHNLADCVAFRLGPAADFLQQFVSDPCLQQGLRCLR